MKRILSTFKAGQGIPGARAGLQATAKAWSMMGFMLLLLMGSSRAMAQEAFQFSEHNYFLKYILTGLLGPIINENGATADAVVTGSGTLGEVFRAFNLGISFFGVIMMIFITVIGILNTGHDGEFLGRKWSSMWVPIRFALGSALMLPVTNSGYNFAQAFVIWIASQGIGFADSVWKATVNTMSPKTGVQIVADTPIASFAAATMTSQICLNAMNEINKKSDTFSSIGAIRMYDKAPRTESVPGAGDTNSWYINFGVEGSKDYSEVCGSFKNQYVVDGSADPYETLREVVGDTHYNEILRMANDFEAPAAAIVDALIVNPKDDIDAELNDAVSEMVSAVSNYTLNLQVNAENQIKNLDPWDPMQPGSPLANQARNKDNMIDLGFAAGGAYYIEMVKIQNVARNALGAVPTYVPPNIKLISAEYSAGTYALIDDVVKKITNMTAAQLANATINTANLANNTAGKSTTADLNKNIFAGLDSSALQDGGWWDNFSGRLADMIIKGVIMVGKDNVTGDNDNWFSSAVSGTWSESDTSVIMQLKTKGDFMIDIGYFVIGVGIVGKAIAAAGIGGADAANNSWVPGSSTVGAVLGVIAYTIDGILDFLTPLLYSLFFALISFGITLSIVIPMLPFMLWVGGIMGLLVLLIESLVAIVIWAVMLMHPSGEGITSQFNFQGSMILLNVFARPALMVMGLASGIFLVEPMVRFINDFFHFAMASLTVFTNGSGLITVLAFSGIYVSLVLSVCKKSFALIHLVPDRVLRWIGGGHENLGDSEPGDRAEGMMGGMGGRLSHATQGAMGNALKSGAAGGAPHPGGNAAAAATGAATGTGGGRLTVGQRIASTRAAHSVASAGVSAYGKMRGAFRG